MVPIKTERLEIRNFYPDDWEALHVFNFNYHNKGYASEGCWAMLDRTFGQLLADRVVTGTAAANNASCRLLERLGFVKTGESTGSFRKTPDGKPIEFIGYAYAISKDEWKAVRELR